jgi:Ogr/Delta-like zinc finger protein
MSPPPAHQPTTRTKKPERCPLCGAPRPIKKDVRAKKLATIQRYQCRNPKCGHTFTSAPGTLKNKTYPLNAILYAITEYNRGTTTRDIATKIRAKYGHRIAPSTILSWLDDYPRLTTYRHLRAEGRKLFPPNQVIRTVKLYHRQVYEFAFHRAKLAMLRTGELDDKRAATKDSSARFAPLADFLEAIPTLCPHGLFRKEDGARGSQVAPDSET